jgi:hypothetical protein
VNISLEYTEGVFNLPEQDLLKLKEAIEKAKTEESQLTGQLTQLHKTLKEDFNCKSKLEAKAYLADIEKQIKEKEKLLTNGVDNLKKELGW